MDYQGKIKSFEKITKGFIEKGYEVLFQFIDYFNSNTPLLVKCSNGHESKIR